MLSDLSAVSLSTVVVSNPVSLRALSLSDMTVENLLDDAVVARSFVILIHMKSSPKTPLNYGRRLILSLSLFVAPDTKSLL
jgi:hypothetical protein